MKRFLAAGLVALVSLALFWTPFAGKIGDIGGIEFGHRGMETIIQNFDGLNFLVIAKSWYNPEVIRAINAQFLTGNEPIYFTAHFPMMGAVVKLFGLVMPYPTALLFTIVLTNGLLGIVLYLFFETVVKDKRLAGILMMVALFFPARMLSVRAVGSNEPLFISLILLSLMWAMRAKYWASAVAGALAVLTRSPGILLFVAYLWMWWRKPSKLAPYLLMPLSLIGLFIFYGFQYHDPLAYFHSGDNLHIFVTPFQIFSNTQSWISDMWREDIIYVYLFYGIGISLIKEKRLKIFGWIYGLTLLFVAHRDLGRYALPIAPLALLGYAPYLEKIPQKAWWILAILLIPIYLLGWQFVLKNVQPINDWGVFL